MKASFLVKLIGNSLYVDGHTYSKEVGDKAARSVLDALKECDALDESAIKWDLVDEPPKPDVLEPGGIISSELTIRGGRHG